MDIKQVNLLRNQRKAGREESRPGKSRGEIETSEHSDIRNTIAEEKQKGTRKDKKRENTKTNGKRRKRRR